MIVFFINQDGVEIMQCPCGSGRQYSSCCDLYISNEELPPTPEVLMRSRYTAYHQNNLDYLAATMKSPALDRFDVSAAKAQAHKIKWTQLEILRTRHDSIHGVVEFRAHYNRDNKKCVLHEISEFIFENGKWFYVDGVHPETSKEVVDKIGRNDVCPCGSGKKFKKCCGITTHA